MADRNQLKLKTNIPETFTFKYDSPKTGTGQYGPWYLYGITHEGQDSGLFATPFQQSFFQWIGVKKDMTIELCLCEGDNNKKYYTAKVGDVEYDSRDMDGEPKNQEAPTNRMQSSANQDINLEDIAGMMIKCYDLIDRGLQSLSEDAKQKMATSVFIEANRRNIIDTSLTKEEDIPMGPEPPESDLPF